MQNNNPEYNVQVNFTLELEKDIKKRQQRLTSLESLLLAKKLPFFISWLPQLFIAWTDSESADAKHIVYWLTFRDWMFLDGWTSLLYLVLEFLHSMSLFLERRNRQYWDDILKEIKNIFYGFKFMILVVGFVKYIALQFFSGIRDGSYKTFAKDYYAVLLVIGIVWGIAFWEEKVLEKQKEKLQHLLQAGNQRNIPGQNQVQIEMQPMRIQEEDIELQQDPLFQDKWKKLIQKDYKKYCQKNHVLTDNQFMEIQQMLTDIYRSQNNSLFTIWPQEKEQIQTKFDTKIEELKIMKDIFTRKIDKIFGKYKTILQDKRRQQLDQLPPDFKEEQIRQDKENAQQGTTDHEYNDSGKKLEEKRKQQPIPANFSSTKSKIKIQAKTEKRREQKKSQFENLETLQ